MLAGVLAALAELVSTVELGARTACCGAAVVVLDVLDDKAGTFVLDGNGVLVGVEVLLKAP